MIYVDIADRKEREAFSKKAAKHFEKNEGSQVYTGGAVEARGLVALKYSEAEGENNSIVLLRVSDDDVELYLGLVKSE